MANSGDGFLIVVSLIQGRHFPLYNDHEIFAEGKFDSQLVRSDPTSHTISPYFNTELAWIVNKKGFSQHKLQRSPIKLQLYIHPKGTQRNEAVGYILLDLRLAQQNLKDFKWYPLLNSKYQKERPEIYVSIHLEKETKPNGITENSKIPIRLSPRQEDFKPRLNASQTVYEIGPAHKCEDKFSLSVTVLRASNLHKLVAPNYFAPNSDFFFYYNLFGSDLSLSSFTNLREPNFQPERASVNIHSQIEFLYKYFQLQPNLEIMLISGQTSIGSCNLDIRELVSHPQAELGPGSTVEGIFKVSNDSSIAIPLSNEEAYHHPNIMISMILKREEEFESSSPSPTEIDMPSGDAPEKPRSARRRLDYSNSPPQKMDKSGKLQDEPKFSLHKLVAATNTPTVNEATAMHGYSFHFDMRSIVSNQQSSSLRCILRYTYPFFGSTSSIITKPMELPPMIEHTIIDGLCTFSFASSARQLIKSFRNHPILVEVVNLVKQSQDKLLGCARVNLNPVLESSPISFTTENGTVGTKKSTSLTSIVFSICGTKKVGKLNIHMSLEDLGPISLDQVLSGEPPGRPSSKAQSSDLRFPEEPSSIHPTVQEKGEEIVGPKVLPSKLSQDDMMHDLVEFEFWKDQQEELFRKQLEEKEKTHVNYLITEWKKRDTEREDTFDKKLKECKVLEQTFRKALNDVNVREKQLISKEEELSKRHQELNRQQAQLKASTKDTLDRNKAETDQLLELERKKCHDLLEENLRFKKMFDELEKKLSDKDNNIIRLQRELSQKDTSPLEAENKILLSEKAELEKKLEASSEGKRHYKQQWVSAITELSLLHEKINRQGEQREDERINALANAKSVLEKDKAQLDEVKNNMASLTLSKDFEESNANEELVSMSEPTVFESSIEVSEITEQTINLGYDHLERLEEEKERLLSTKVYTQDNPIIKDITAHIDKIKAGKDKQ